MSTSEQDLKQAVEDLELAQATEEATVAGAQATMVATQMGTGSTPGASQVGVAAAATSLVRPCRRSRRPAPPALFRRPTRAGSSGAVLTRSLAPRRFSGPRTGYEQTDRVRRGVEPDSSLRG